MNNLTKIIHDGYDSKLSEGSLVTPIFRTSTFCFKNAQQGERAFEIAYGLDNKKENEEVALIYSRVNNPNMEILENKLKNLDNTEECVVCSSGMSAISNTMLSLLNNGEIVIYSAPVYGGTHYLFNGILPKFNIKCIDFNSGSNSEDLIKLFLDNENIKMIFIETPNNPLLQSTSLKEINLFKEKYEEKHGKKLIVTVDNTISGPEFFKPNRFNIDLIIYSITKFISGHSDLVAGCVSGKKEYINQIRVLRTIFGSIPDSDTCWLIQRSLSTLKIRMKEQCNNCMKIFEYLKNHPKISKIYYPGFNSNNQKNIFEEEMIGSGSILSFEINLSKEKIFEFLNNLEVFKLAVSLGSVESLIQHPSSMTHSDLTIEEKYKYNIKENLVRISVGLENHLDLINDINSALKKI